MLIVKVIKPLVSTNRIPDFEHKHLQVVLDGSTKKVAVDAVGVAAYDLAAIQPIVEAAGGRFTDRLGEATHLHDTAISSNGLLHDEAIARLR